MASDKIYRVLALYRQMLDGGLVDKTVAAERYDVNERSILRDIVDIREFLEMRSLQGDGNETVVYDRKGRGYRLVQTPPAPEAPKTDETAALDDTASPL